MDASITAPVVEALPQQFGADSAPFLDLSELRDVLEDVANEALDARMQGVTPNKAVLDSRFPALMSLHKGLRDSLLLEIPPEIQSWVANISGPGATAPSSPGTGTSGQFHNNLFRQAHRQDVSNMEERSEQLRTALSETLLFESVHLHLLVGAWSSTEFESVGGDEEDIGALAWNEVEALLQEPALLDPEIRTLPVMIAAGTVALADDAARRSEELELVGSQKREELNMRAKLRAALRELRLPEAVLLENALSNLLGEDRQDLTELQQQHPIALEGMSRQAMDQRVSRGRRALTHDRANWPSRRRPALFDLLRTPSVSALA